MFLAAVGLGTVCGLIGSGIALWQIMRDIKSGKYFK